jgi:hypothetical protein
MPFLAVNRPAASSQFPESYSSGEPTFSAKVLQSEEPECRDESGKSEVV